MSNSLERAVRDLTLAVRALTIATQNLSSSTSTARPGECGSDYLIEVVSESYEQFYFAECRLARAFRGVETGPPTLPDLLLEFAEEKLQLAMVLLGALSVCISWGWIRLAGSFALMWGGLLRPGELCKATRKDLLLPCDLGGTIPFCILSIGEPKTRYSSARHQSAKVDMADMVAIIGLAFGELRPHHKLWPYSPQTLRQRLKSVLTAMWLPVVGTSMLKPLDLGSFRPGGATHIIQMTEDGELLQRRGRWANRKTMEIYVQEVSSLLYLKQVDPKVRQRVLQLASAFPDLLRKASAFTAASIPTTVWYILLTQ